MYPGYANRPSDAIECERKFKLNITPRQVLELVGEQRPVYIEQHYLTKGTVGLRIRSSRFGDARPEYRMAVKLPKDERGSGLEVEQVLSKKAYELLAAHSLGSVRKNRYVSIYRGQRWELDLFLEPAGLLLAELEYDDKFPPKDQLPPWLGEDVTSNPEYTNQRIALAAAHPGR